MQSIKRNGTLFTFYTSWPIEDLSIPKDKLLKGKAFQKYYQPSGPMRARNKKLEPDVDLS